MRTKEIFVFTVVLVIAISAAFIMKEPSPTPSPTTTSSPPKPPEGLIFSSGFEEGVYLDKPTIGADQWVQYMRGGDKNYDWIEDLPSGYEGSNKFFYGVRSDYDPSNYVETRIDDVVGHDGSPTRALYMAVKDIHGGAEANARNQYDTTIKNNVLEEAYVRYRIKLQPNLKEVMAVPWGWRFLMEWFETAPQEYGWVDYIFTIGIRMDDENRLFWKMNGKEKQVPGGTYVDQWSEKSYDPSPESIAGKWALLEVYWKRSTGDDGVVQLSINGVTVLEHLGRNKKDSSLALWNIFKIYASPSVINAGVNYQWIDDVELYETIQR